MNPDAYEPREHTYPLWEGEVTLNGRDFYVVAEITETREPVKKENGKLGSQSFYDFELLEVFPARGDSYSDRTLAGAALNTWKVRHGNKVAEDICERINDRERD